MILYGVTNTILYHIYRRTLFYIYIYIRVKTESQVETSDDYVLIIRGNVATTSLWILIIASVSARSTDAPCTFVTERAGPRRTWYTPSLAYRQLRERLSQLSLLILSVRVFRNRDRRKSYMTTTTNQLVWPSYYRVCTTYTYVGMVRNATSGKEPVEIVQQYYGMTIEHRWRQEDARS